MNSERLNKLSKEQLIELVLKLNNTSCLKVRIKTAYAKQVEGLATMLDEITLATSESLSEKDEKKWERGRIIMKELPDYVAQLEKLEERLIPVSKDAVKLFEQGSDNSIESMRDA